MSDELARAARSAGIRLADALWARPQASQGAFFGTVSSVAGATATVEAMGATLAGLPMTTACGGAREGDRCVLARVGAGLVVIGIVSR
ncbi:hypothetical protein [Olsenella urininfantis]|uniref:hypothetical protein n=1 Tax=Olsenella urininfantis TaxID=1871033 RepID=UPI000987C77D|nr:hypothetical protein [Olsenella urininfantis]